MIVSPSCPFCGSGATSPVWLPYDGAHAMVAIRCDTCRARGPHTFDEVKAREAWDTRATAQPHNPTKSGEEAP